MLMNNMLMSNMLITIISETFAYRDIYIDDSEHIIKVYKICLKPLFNVYVWNHCIKNMSETVVNPLPEMRIHDWSEGWEQLQEQVGTRYGRCRCCDCRWPWTYCRSDTGWQMMLPETTLSWTSYTAKRNSWTDPDIELHRLLRRESVTFRIYLKDHSDKS